MITWLNELQGLLVLMPSTTLAAWRGIDADHYDKACEVTEYLETIDVEGNWVIVLGDEPALVGVRTKPDGFELYRWIYAPSVESAGESLAHWRAENALQEPVLFNHPGGHLVIQEGTCSQSSDPRAYFAIALRQGQYSAETYGYSPDDETEFVIHKVSLDEGG
jgi:hypothetical protein